jgi:diguanylate cyclase (GGDEF)-like protein/PAS domain S-box-containing protein
MRFGPNNTSVPRVSILLAAILLGIAIGITIVPNRALISVRPTLFSVGILIATVLCIAAFILLGLAYLASTTDRSHQLDRDLLEAFLEHIPDSVFFKDKESRFIRISRAMANYCGLKDPARAIGKTDADIFSPEQAGQALADEQRMLRTGEPMIEKEEKETWKDGHETWALTTKVPLKNREGKVIGTMGIAHNITHRKQAEQQIQHMALHDSLTGLPNRTLLEDRLGQAIALAQRVHKHVAVLLLDLDRFKNVNDSFGHSVGDRLLVLVSERLKACIRKCDAVARLGGDEFAIAVQMAERLEGIELVARKVLDTLSEPFQVEDRELQISASIGICQFPEDGKNARRLAAVCRCCDVRG